MHSTKTRAKGEGEIPLGWATAGSGSTCRPPRGWSGVRTAQDGGWPGPAQALTAAHSDAQGKQPIAIHSLAVGYSQPPGVSVVWGAEGGGWTGVSGDSPQSTPREAVLGGRAVPRSCREAVCKAAVISSHLAPHLIIIPISSN